MGFNSTTAIPYLRTYAEAKKRYEDTKPIRGDKEGKRPLGDRRHKHMHISEAVVDGATVYKCHCYGTPMVTYYPDDTVELAIAHSTAFTREFLMQLLSQLIVRASKNRTVVNPCGTKDKFVIGKGNTLKLKWRRGLQLLASGGSWTVVQAEAALEWTLNKAKANIVRQPYAEFLNYYKGMTSLLKEDVDFEVRYANRRWNRPTADTPFVTKNEVVLPMATLVSMFGTSDPTYVHGHQTLNLGASNAIGYTWIPQWGEEAARAKAIREVKANQQKVLALMRSDQPEDTKGDNYYKAALLILLQGMTFVATKAEAVRIATSRAKQKADEFVLRTHKEEVLEQKRMPIGKIATTNYASWFDYI